MNLKLTLMFVDDETEGFMSTKRAILSSMWWAFSRMLGLQQPQLLLMEAILDKEDLGHLVVGVILDSKHLKPIKVSLHTHCDRVTIGTQGHRDLAPRPKQRASKLPLLHSQVREVVTDSSKVT